MRHFECPPFSPAENLAADEVLLTTAEKHDWLGGALRLWQSSVPFAVIGRGSKFAAELDLVACQSAGTPVLRRISGGATVLTGPGCLMYAVVMRHTGDPRLATIDSTHDFILKTTAAALNSVCRDEAGGAVGRYEIQVAGTSDLALRDLSKADEPLRKVSGNAMRRGRNFTLYHGTLLYDFDLDLIGRYLATAPRQPEYRAAREHGDFVANLPLSREAIAQSLVSAWGASPAESPSAEMLAEIRFLADTKYSQDSWNLRH